MFNAVKTASEAIALGLNIKRDTFTSMMEGGVQLLAPTGSDLNKYTKKNDILAGFHYGKPLLISVLNLLRSQLHNYPRKEQIPRAVHLAEEWIEASS